MSDAPSAMAQSGRCSRTSACPLLDQSGQSRILAGDGLSAYDPKRTWPIMTQGTFASSRGDRDRDGVSDGECLQDQVRDRIGV